MHYISKGTWNQKLDVSKTRFRDFHLLNGKIVQVPYMTGVGYEDNICRSFEGHEILKLPYGSCLGTRQFSMYFFLPEKNDGLPDLVKMFDSKPGFFNQEFELRKVELPKFCFEFEAKETMKEMGLDRPFKPGELTKMVDSPDSEDLCLYKLFQKSRIEVKEKGTEAAATTVAIIRQQQARYPNPSFVADHPFMFMTREETHLLAGK
uniref:Serpin domain-containing protein n=1 Tax=Populus trichocarpa TaxID=3694 RepID=B9N6P5_POPTR